MTHFSYQLRFRHYLLLTTFLLFMTSFPVHGQSVVKVPMSSSRFVDWVPGRLVVNFEHSVLSTMNRMTAAEAGITGNNQLDQLGRQLGVLSLKPQFPSTGRRNFHGRDIDLNGWYSIAFSNPVAAEVAADMYSRFPGVLDAQPIGIHTQDGIPNDGFYSQQWHLDQSGDHDIDAPDAWDSYTGNAAIIVGILDSGVRFYHKDLGGADASYSSPMNSQGNMWLNEVELNAGASNGIDDDGNGFIDDWIGWDFVTGVGSIPKISGEDYDDQDNDPSDFNGHGTHCAGNVGAINNNGYGTAAVAGGWGDGTLQATADGVKVMALRIGYSSLYQGQEAGFVRMDYAAQAIQYAADNGARIISCSWGSSNSGGIAAAIDYFLAGGGLIFKAAGNEGTSTADYICARGDANIISVAATDSFDLKADFSNYGAWVDISAPGVDILSSYHDHNNPQNDYVASISGTSMATPIAAGTAALIWSVNPDLSADLIRQILFDGTDDIDALNPAYAGLLGVGRVNAYMPLLDSSLPVELGSFTARYDSGAVILEWETFSELENLGFEIYRGIGKDSTDQLIASFKQLEILLGLGNSPSGRRYRYVDREAISGFLNRYYLHDVDYGGRHTAHGPVIMDLRGKDQEEQLLGNRVPDDLRLINFPNPFNSSTNIEFTLPRPEYTILRIYDILGVEVVTLVSDNLASGRHSCYFDASRLTSGVYYYQVSAGAFRDVKKMILLR